MDAWDPNTWDALWAEQQFFIYGDDALTKRCVVDWEDYTWACQWRWHVNEPHPRRLGHKRYFCRNTSNGARWGPKLYLHIEIMKRKGIERPSPKHIVDHRSGNEWDCRRSNLDWTTPRGNAKNQWSPGPPEAWEGLVGAAPVYPYPDPPLPWPAGS
jgi:hypothetical protein